MTTWMVIVAVGVGSYAMRALPMLLDTRWARSPRVEQAIAHAGTAALAALIALGLRRSATSAGDTAAVAMATAAAALVAVRQGSLPKVLLVGAAAYASAKGAVWVLA